MKDQGLPSGLRIAHQRVMGSSTVSMFSPPTLKLHIVAVSIVWALIMHWLKLVRISSCVHQNCVFHNHGPKHDTLSIPFIELIIYCPEIFFIWRIVERKIHTFNLQCISMSTGSFWGCPRRKLCRVQHSSRRWFHGSQLNSYRLFIQVEESSKKKIWDQ